MSAPSVSRGIIHSYPVDSTKVASLVLTHGQRENCLVLSPASGLTQVPNVTPATTIYARSSVLAPNNSPAMTHSGVSPPFSVVDRPDPRGKQKHVRFAVQPDPRDLRNALHAESLNAALEALVGAGAGLAEEQEQVEETGGVLENTTWQETIEEDVARGLARLANLAEDDHKVDPSRSAGEHYNARLGRLLLASPIPVGVAPFEQ